MLTGATMHGGSGLRRYATFEDTMPDFGFTLFDTPIARCGIAWGPRGMVALQLPEATPAATRGRLLRGCPEAVEAAAPETVRAVIAAIAALLRGEPCDLGAIDLDMDKVPEFHRRV
jgi:methylated-DNA-[protein]-cysteine S-methyltransferase